MLVKQCKTYNSKKALAMGLDKVSILHVDPEGKYLMRRVAVIGVCDE